MCTWSGCYIYAHDWVEPEREVSVSDTASITSLLNDNSNSNSNKSSSFEELEEQPPAPPTTRHLHPLASASSVHAVFG